MHEWIFEIFLEIIDKGADQSPINSNIRYSGGWYQTCVQYLVALNVQARLVGTKRVQST